MTIFLEAILYTLSITVIDTSKELTQEYDKRINIRKNLKDDLNPRQIKIMEFLNDNPKITRREYSRMMGVSFMTGYRDLQDLLQKKYIYQKGEGRGSYYFIPDEDTREQERIENEIKIFG